MLAPSHDILELPAPPAGLRLRYGEQGLHFGDLRLPCGAGSPSPPGFPVALVIHGGFWRSRYTLDYFGHACAALAATGIATWNIEYRRIGDPGGGWPGTFDDVAAAADHLRVLARDYPLDLGRVVAVGHSAGGHLALWLAGRWRLQERFGTDPLPFRAAIALGAVTDLRRCWELRLSDDVAAELLGGAPDDYPERYAAASPAELLPLGAPQVLIHGEDDATVPVATCRDYAARAEAAGDAIALHVLPGTGHFEVVDPRTPQWRIVADAIVAAL